MLLTTVANGGTCGSSSSSCVRAPSARRSGTSRCPPPGRGSPNRYRRGMSRGAIDAGHVERSDHPGRIAGDADRAPHALLERRRAPGGHENGKRSKQHGLLHDDLQKRQARSRGPDAMDRVAPRKRPILDRSAGALHQPSCGHRGWTTRRGSCRRPPAGRLSHHAPSGIKATSQNPSASGICRSRQCGMRDGDFSGQPATRYRFCRNARLLSAFQRGNTSAWGGPSRGFKELRDPGTGRGGWNCGELREGCGGAGDREGPCALRALQTWGAASATAKRAWGLGRSPIETSLVSPVRSGRAAAQKSDKTFDGRS